MYRLFVRTITLMVVLLLIGCSGGGNPTAPGTDNPAPTNQIGELTQSTAPQADNGDQTERVLGNFYYVTENEETLAWGTVLLTREGWDYRLDYVAPKLRALRRSDTSRNAQAVVDLTWLKLIAVGVSYTNKPPPIPPELAKYAPGEFMQYRVDIKNRTPFTHHHETVIATQVNMFNVPLGPDAKDIWENVTLPKSGTSLFGDWTVDPGLSNGIYYTRVMVGLEVFCGWLKIVIFDSKAGAFKVEKGGGPQYFDPVAKGVTTTPVVAVGENVHVQDNGSFDPDGGAIVKYEWDINNDGTFDYTGPSADYSYPSPGVYYVNLRVTDNEGATDDLTDDPGDQLIKITVTPPPVPPVAIGKASEHDVYVGQNITFDGSGSYDPDGGAIVLYEWDWDGDGTYDETGPVLDHAYTDPGTYFVQLQVTDDELQIDTLDQPLEIHVKAMQHPPTACAEWSIDPVGKPIPCQEVKFDASCSTDPLNDITLYEWDWDNDGTWDFSSPTPVAYHSYDTSGDFDVQLRVTDSAGNTDMLDAPLAVEVVNMLPTSVAAADKNNVHMGETVYFDGSGSHDNDCDGASIVKYQWDFDNNGTWDAEGVTTSHAYDSPGLFHVKLQVTDNEGGTATNDPPLDITVSIEYFPPVAKAVADPLKQTVCEPINFHDDGSYDPDGGLIQKYEWDWNNDGVYDEEGPNFWHSGAMPGIYHIQFRVTDDEGQTDTLDVPIEVEIVNALPTAAASADNYTPDVGEEVNFDGSGSHDNDCDDQAIVKWEWDFENDGTYDAEGMNVSHSYDSPGLYEVQLRVTDDEDGTDTLDTPLKISVSLNHLDPIAIADAEPKSAPVCYTISFFDNGSYDPDGGPITKYEWDWDNDGTFDETGANVSHSWDGVGTYYVQFRVTDDDGATDALDTPIQIDIYNNLPTAVAKADKYNAYVGETVNFDGSGSYDNDCDGQAIVMWEWDWTSDGTYEDSGEFVPHAFGEPDLYNVQLRVTDDEGGTAILAQPLQITISKQYFPPVAYADADPKQALICEPIHFYDDGSYDPDGGAITKYEWDWDNDGTFDETGADVYHSWDTVGPHYVQFRVTDDEGVTATLAAPIQVDTANALPTAVAQADKYNAFVGETVNFDGSGSHDNDCNDQSIVSWEWDWTNDGIFEGSGEFAGHSYPDPGTYYVQLRVTDNEGTTDLLDQTLQINVSKQYFPPVAYADADPKQALICEPIHFYDDGSYDPDGGAITKYEWDWDNDGTFDETGADVYHSWDTVGPHYVQFRVTDDEGVTATLAAPIQVDTANALPTAVAQADKYNAFVNETVNFDGSGSHDNDCNDQSIVSWEWDWTNDGVFEGSGEFAGHSYPDPGTYYVQLRVTDNEGTTDLLDQTLQINVSKQYFPPVAYADADPKQALICEPIHFFDDGSYDPDGGAITKYEWDWDNDGTFDETGADVYHSWDTVGPHYVQFRVTDDEGVTATLAAPIQVDTANALPTAVAQADKYNAFVNETVNFDGSGSHDNDCNDQSIVSWLWDWDNNGVYDEEGAHVSHSWDSPGLYDVQLKVTDNEGTSDILDTPLQITISLEPCPAGIHSFFNNRGVSDGYSTLAYSVLPRADIAYIEAGAFAGQAIVQGGPNSLVTFDPDYDNDNPINDNVFSMPTNGSGHKLLVTSLDSAPYANIVAEVTSDKPTEVKFIDTSVLFGGNLAGSYDVGGLVMALDFDANGDIYTVVKSGELIRLVKLVYLGGTEPTYQAAGDVSISQLIGYEIDVFDLAVSWTEDALYVFDAGGDGYGRVTSFHKDLSALAVANDVMDGPIEYEANEAFGVAGFADIDIDHQSGKEGCRILLYARIGGQAEIEKRDSDLNLISLNSYSQSWPSAAINPEPVVTDRDLMMPGENDLGFWNAPSDW
jgi:PKD repeat protein